MCMCKLKENWKYYIFEVLHCIPMGIWNGYKYKKKYANIFMKEVLCGAKYAGSASKI